VDTPYGPKAREIRVDVRGRPDCFERVGAQQDKVRYSSDGQHAESIALTENACRGAGCRLQHRQPWQRPHTSAIDLASIDYR